MTPIYLSFPSATVAQSALFEADGSVRFPDLEILNPVPMPVARDTGDLTSDGVPLMEPVPGYHVNAVAPPDTDLSALDQWRMHPTTPFAVLYAWPGQQVV